MTLKQLAKIFTTNLVLLALLTQCGKKVENVQVSIELPKAPSRGAITLPSVISDFNCIFVNVMGTGIATATDYTDYATVSTSVATEGTIALSLTSALIAPANGGTMTVTVPAGTSRIFSLVGVKTSETCGAATLTDLMDTTKYTFMTELSRQTADITADKTITMDISQTGYGSKSESRLNKALAAPTYASTTPATQKWDPFGPNSTLASVTITFSQNMATPSTSNFSITKGTCTATPAVGSVSVSDKTITVTFATPVNCGQSNAFTLNWSGLKNTSGVATTGATTSLLFTNDY